FLERSLVYPLYLKKCVKRSFLLLAILIDNEIIEHLIEEWSEVFYFVSLAYIHPHFGKSIVNDINCALAVANTQECVPKQRIPVLLEGFQETLFVVLWQVVGLFDGIHARTIIR